VLALGAPLLSEHIRQRRGRRGQRPLRRRPHRAAIEREAEAPLSLRRRDLIIEPTPQARPHAAARGLVWIERLVLEDILKDFAHVGVLFTKASGLPLNGVENVLNQAPGQEPFVHGCCPKFAFH
jgi:hypothetical protein